MIFGIWPWASCGAYAALLKWGGRFWSGCHEIERELGKYKPSVVINTAAKINIDWCESNGQEAFD